MSKIEQKKISVRKCPSCGRHLKSVLDYPLMRILSFQRISIPDNAYSSCAINGPSEMEVNRAARLWLSLSEVNKTDLLPDEGCLKKQKKVYLLDRYTNVLGAGEAFKQFQASGKEMMKFKNLLFERNKDIFQRETFTVQKDMMPEIKEVLPNKLIDNYLRRIKRMVGKIVKTKVLYPSWKRNSNIGVDLFDEEKNTVRIAITFHSGGTVAVIEPLFYLAKVELKGKLLE